MNNKAQVVYYLSHSGRLEQPHLIEVEHQNERLLLRDVKKRLMLLRGKEMPDFFSWAYKRSYKNDFIWNDVTEEDAIFPLFGQEYVLKGSGSYSCDRRECCKSRTDRKDNQDSCSSPSSLPSPYKSSVGHMRTSEIYERASPSPLSSQTDHRSNAAASGALRVNRQLMESLTQAKALDGAVDGTGATLNAPSEESISHKVRDVKIYKTKASPVTADHGRDVATQTEDNAKTASTQEDMRAQPADDALADAQCGASRKPAPCCLGQASSEGGCKASVGKQGSSAAVLRQLLRCGGVDTNTSPSVQSKVQCQVQNWARSKAEGALTGSTNQDGEVTSHQGLRSSSSSGNFNSKRDLQCNEDPESMPEVVKETSNDARSLTDWTPRTVPEKVPASPRLGFENESDNSPRYSLKKQASRGASLKSMTNSEEVQQLQRPTSLPADLSPPKKELRCRDDRPLTPGRSRLDWERTLQAAVQLSAPPVDFRQILQACPQCGRTFKPESLKVHTRGCRGQNTRAATTTVSHVSRRLQ